MERHDMHAELDAKEARTGMPAARRGSELSFASFFDIPYRVHWVSSKMDGSFLLLCARGFSGALWRKSLEAFLLRDGRAVRRESFDAGWGSIEAIVSFSSSRRKEKAQGRRLSFTEGERAAKA